jgi:hypothetical protein
MAHPQRHVDLHLMPRTAEFTIEFLTEFLTEFRGVELDEFPPITAMTRPKID